MKTKDFNEDSVFDIAQKIQAMIDDCSIKTVIHLALTSKVYHLERYYAILIYT